MSVPQEFENLLFEKTWEGEGSRFRMSIDVNHYAVVRFHGKGSMAGTKAFVATLDEGHARLGDPNDVRAMLDLSCLHGVPLRAQLLLGKWLLANKEHFHCIAVFGGKTWEMNFARAVAKIARFKNIGFYDDEAPSLTYLNS
ncbi:MAG: STAS/SEC14 domain-containing protein [Kofleriaceae bacterium]|nr:STAS/SEC14 domain-containing protein [Kofleriaceae bacterium]